MISEVMGAYREGRRSDRRNDGNSERNEKNRIYYSEEAVRSE